MKIWQCGDDNPPSRASTSVKLYGTVKSTLDIPFSSLSDYTNRNGEKMKKMSYLVEMIPSGASLEFAVSIGGRRLGKSNVAVKF